MLIFILEGKTDYYARKRLITQDKNKYSSPKYRFVVRITNKDIVCQIIYARIQGDFVLTSAYSHELPKYGIKAGLTNYAAAYCTGLLCARRALTSLGLADKYQGCVNPDGEAFNVEADGEGARPFKCYLDVGLQRTTTGARIFGAMKGLADGGVFIPHSEKRFPGYDKETNKMDSEMLRKYIFGGHVAEYMELLQDEDEEKYKSQFSKMIEYGMTADNLEEIYTNAHAAIRSDPTPSKSASKPEDFAENSKTYKKRKLTLKERRNKVQQKIAAHQHKMSLN